VKILWLTWKDSKHPQAGGAEVVSSELAKRLVKAGHEVTFVTSGYKNASHTDTIDGYSVIRVGGRFTVYWQAYRYIKKNLADWPDLVVEEINTIPFCTRFYLRDKPRLMFFHMLCREIWFYQLRLPLSVVGYALEPIYLRLLSAERAIAMSLSTKKDLIRHGFHPKKVAVISEGIELEPITHLEPSAKHSKPTIVSLGSIRPMKRTMDQIKAFELAKAEMPDLQMMIAGGAGGNYGKKVLETIARSPYAADIKYLGRISAAEKLELLQRAHLITVTSVKEGWGLIVTEAASQGTPAAVYNVDGLRDSVQHGKTGSVCTENTPAQLAKNIVDLLSDTAQYRRLQQNAWEWSKQINFETSFKQFSEAVES
jgi:glycosyltransferase involved in cell wall biosynthesis